LTQGDRQLQFRAPLSGTVVRTNEQLAGAPGAVQEMAYGANWLCVIEGDNLDAELPGLKIGKSAIAFFHEEVERIQGFLQNVGIPASEALNTGALEKLDESGWDAVAKAHFAG
jgi:hypothetical protein